MSASKRKVLSQEFIDDADAESEDAEYSDGSDKKPTKKAKAVATKKSAPPKKKVKKAESDEEEEESDGEGGSGSGGLEKNKDGDSFLSLGSGAGNKRITVRKFKSNSMIDIRETYEKDGNAGLPGKKGISLNPAQWDLLKANLALIDGAIDAL